MSAGIILNAYVVVAAPKRRRREIYIIPNDK
jgi:hypothetical protein